jgi:hypothetical protein
MEHNFVRDIKTRRRTPKVLEGSNLLKCLVICISTVPITSRTKIVPHVKWQTASGVKQLGATVESLCSLGVTLQCPAFSARWETPLVKFFARCWQSTSSPHYYPPSYKCSTPNKKQAEVCAWWWWWWWTLEKGLGISINYYYWEVG